MDGLIDELNGWRAPDYSVLLIEILALMLVLPVSNGSIGSDFYET
jgi:hypothetical protein